MNDETKPPYDQGDDEPLLSSADETLELAVIDQSALDSDELDGLDATTPGDVVTGAPKMEMASFEPASTAPARMVACPQCGTPNPDAAGRRVAEAFCSECDFPLFFAGGVVQAVEESTDGRDRLPGVAGRDRRTWVGCPECGELNPRDGLHCLRCGAVLHPPVVPEPEPLPEPEFLTPEPVLLPAPPCRRWPMFLLGFAAGWVAMLVAFVMIDRWG